MRHKHSFFPKWLVIFFLGSLISCGKVSQTPPTSLVLSTLVSTQRIMSTPTSVNNQITPIIGITPGLPSIISTMESTTTFVAEYQLTYVLRSMGGSEPDRLYAIDVGCLNEKRLCFGASKLLFKALESGSGPQIRIFNHSWSPDGKQIAVCAGGIEGKGDIFVADISKIKWVNITSSPIDECYPKWSPDGRSIAFTACSKDLYNGCRILVTTNTGEKITELLEQLHYLNPQHSAWMPDGERISFETSDENGHWQIYLANLDGSNLVQVTNEEMDSNSPSITPDGRTIVFERIRDQGHIDIFQTDLFSKEELKILGDASERYSDSILAPFGKWIAFTSMRGISGGTNIFLVSLDGKTLIPITQGGGEYKRYPAWRYLANP